jgi:hypothetical protein
VEQLKLPNGLASVGDVLRLKREVNSLNDYFAGAAARTPGSSQPPPKTTRILEEFAKTNGANLLDASHRKKMEEYLDQLSKDAPQLHISFATEPTPKSVEPVLEWLRQNIHPQCLLMVGVQPSIAAGCVLRTSNKIFDMSLRIHLQKQSHLLSQLIAGAVDGR